MNPLAIHLTPFKCLNSEIPITNASSLFMITTYHIGANGDNGQTLFLTDSSVCRCTEEGSGLFGHNWVERG